MAGLVPATHDLDDEGSARPRLIPACEAEIMGSRDKPGNGVQKK